MNEGTKNTIGIAFACFLAIYANKGINWLIGYQPNNMIPRASEVEPGYVAPSDIEIKCKNFDKRNELPETFQNIKGRSYLLKWDENGHPILQEYKVKSQEIVPKDGEKNE